ncbi:class I SAM-dependent methyltransferase [Treponema sp. OMZ 840]|uniref:class I SAM-dependent methyltransferase n=1 Tax=Treponema sp. OMZ 840 TaxID=244313 RepID=UPI003D942418
MEFLENLVEYYDELYPVSDEQVSFFNRFLEQYSSPVKVLRIDCASGAFEHTLARQGFDVTGTDASREFINTAVRRRRTPNAGVRFFQMAPVEIGRFLAKDFYNCIYILEDSLYFIGDEILLRKFFCDCRSVLAFGGALVLHIPGFPAVRESIRIKLVSVLEKDEHSGSTLLTQNLERGAAQLVPVRSKTPVFMPPAETILNFAKEAGFSSFLFYSDWRGQGCNAQKASVWVLT